jgi:putative hemolysin
MPVDPFSFDLPSRHPGRAAAYVARPLLSRLLGLDALRSAYAELPAGPPETFASRVLAALRIEIALSSRDLRHIPCAGPLIVAANHPRGAIDGLVLASVLGRVRPDVRLMANRLLSRIPELREVCFFVDPFEGSAAASRSLPGLRAAHVWLRRGGAMVMFPAGEVSGHTPDRTPRERTWSGTLGRLATATGATVIPAFLDGANSAVFHAAGRIHPRLRTLLLPRETLRARGARVAVHFGGAMPAEPRATLTMRTQQALATLRDPEHPRLTPAGEIARLPRSAQLLQSGRYDVFHAEALDIPATLREIGRLRAVTFGAVGEGTGSEMDLDDFDAHYLHLFVWDRERQQVVGAYRIGRTDRIVRDRGLDGLYTRTLFHYGAPLIEALSPALELGRSFVRLEYQKDYQPLLLLWRGIGRFVVRHPEYRCLFGPVSISARYTERSRAVMTAYIERHHSDSRLSQLVTPKHPCSRDTCTPPETFDSTAATDRLISSLEPDGKGMPVLLRQYLRLEARALGVSIDPSFGGVTDALMVVDLPSVDPVVLRKYVGDDGLAVYRAHHLPARMPAA